MSRALWYVAPGRAELRDAPARAPGPGEAVVRTLWSTLSRGTERLVLTGGVSDPERMRAPMQEGEFPYPVKYGYCAVGRVEAGPAALLGRTVFALHPHQEAFVAPLEALAPLPDGVPPRRAVIAANLETALNAVWDSGVGPGDKVTVVGAGPIGLLVAFLVSGMPGTEVTVVDVERARRPLVESFGARFRRPLDGPDDCDAVFHASATAAGLACALACAGDGATVTELSWYGAAPVAAPLGLDFHTRRLRLVSSQVGGLPPARLPRWTPRRRLMKALELLADPRLDALITGEVAFADLPSALPALLAPGAEGLCTAIRY